MSTVPAMPAMPAITLPLHDMDIASLERATLDAVAPPYVAEVGHWLLPMDHSTIGRAKSAVPLRHHDIDPRQLQTVIDCYAARGHAAVFRLTDMPALAKVHAELRRLGWRPHQATLVQVGTVAQLLALGSTTLAEVSPAPHEAWASVYTGHGFDPVDGAHRVQSLSRSRHVVYATLCENGMARAAGTAAFSQGWASLHGMRTLPDARGRGLATQVLVALAQQAQARGLQRVFLQVDASNHAALALYARAGLVNAWRYHYWKPAASVPGDLRAKGCGGDTASSVQGGASV